MSLHIVWGLVWSNLLHHDRLQPALHALGHRHLASDPLPAAAAGELQAELGPSRQTVWWMVLGLSRQQGLKQLRVGSELAQQPEAGGPGWGPECAPAADA